MKNNVTKTTSYIKPDGFTLVELLISLSLSSVVLLILVSSFYQLNRNWEQQNNLLDERIDNSLILIEIEKAISAAYPFTYKDKSSLKKNIFFMGQEKKLQWVSTVSPSYDGAIMIWSMTLLDNGFELFVIPALSGNPENQINYALSNEETNKMILFEEYSIKLSYLFSDAEDQSEWLNLWSIDEKKSLPSAIRIYFDANKDHPQLKSFDLISPIASYQPNKSILR